MFKTDSGMARNVLKNFRNRKMQKTKCANWAIDLVESYVCAFQSRLNIFPSSF